MGRIVLHLAIEAAGLVAVGDRGIGGAECRLIGKREVARQARVVDLVRSGCKAQPADIIVANRAIIEDVAASAGALDRLLRHTRAKRCCQAVCQVEFIIGEGSEDGALLANIRDERHGLAGGDRRRARPARGAHIGAGAKQRVRVLLTAPDRVGLAEIFVGGIDAKQGGAVLPFGLQTELLRILAEVAQVGEVRVEQGISIQGDRAVKVEAIVLLEAFKCRQRGQRPGAEVTFIICRDAIECVVGVPHAVAADRDLVIAEPQRVIARGGVDAIVFLIMRAHQKRAAKGFVPVEAKAQAELIPLAASGLRAAGIVQRRPARQIAPGEAIAEATSKTLPIGALDIRPVQIAIAGADVSRLSLTGAFGQEVDRAAGGIAPEQRALRTLQHFDARKVVQHEAGLHIRRQQHAVGIDRGCARCQRLMVDRADAADLEGDLRPVGDGGLNPGQQVGHVLGSEIGGGEA